MQYPLPLPSLRLRPSAYPMGSAAMREFLFRVPLLLYPTVSSAGTSRICSIMLLRVDIGWSVASSAIGEMPYSPIPNRTISYCAVVNLSAPALLHIWRRILWLNADCSVDAAFSKRAVCSCENVSNSGLSLPAKCENIERGVKAFCCFRASTSVGISSGRNPRRCMPVSTFICTG